MYKQYQIHAQLMKRCKHKINQSGSRVGVGRVGISLCVIYSLRLQSEPLKYSVMEHGNLCEDKTKNNDNKPTKRPKTQQKLGGGGGGSHPPALNTAFEDIRVVDRGGERRSGILDVDGRGEEGML